MVYILHAGGADAAAMALIHQAGFAHHWDENTIRLLLDKPTNLALNAYESPGAAIGFIMLRQVADEAEVLTIATDPKKRRKGVGALLLAHAVDLVRLRGAKKMFLEVASNNKAALRLYEAHGFAEIDRRKGYYRQARSNPEDAIIMSKSLA